MIRDEQQLQERIAGFLGRKQAQYPEIASSNRVDRISPKARLPRMSQQPMPATTITR
jgi:hypothetical protein